VAICLRFRAEHWNGSSWSQVTVPGQYNILTNLTAISATDILALGREYINTTNTYLTLAEHWNGSQWSVDSTPNPSPTFNALYGGAAVSGRDVWAVGTYADTSGKSSDPC
jgi:hypothetical protein